MKNEENRTIDLDSLNLCFENFFGGTLIVYANTDTVFQDVFTGDEANKDPFEQSNISNLEISETIKNIQDRLNMRCQ